MKLASSNPILATKKFDSLLTKEGRYPAEHVDIFWNRDDSVPGVITDVEVAFVPRDALNDDDLRRKFGAYNKHWMSNMGNSCAGWPDGDHMTPANIFGILLRHGFKDQGTLRATLEEFAHIEECDWARCMLEEFRD